MQTPVTPTDLSKIWVAIALLFAMVCALAIILANELDTIKKAIDGTKPAPASEARRPEGNSEP